MLNPEYPKTLKEQNKEYIADDVYKTISPEDEKLYHNAWIGTYPFGGMPPTHFHCCKCVSEDFVFMNGDKVCAKCLEKGIISNTILCIPIICGSS